MKLSKNSEVQELLVSIAEKDETLFEAAQALRKLVFDLYPQVTERKMYGGIIFTLNDDFGGVFVYKNHVSFEFSYGYKLEDTYGILEGKGKYRRHIKVTSIEDQRLKKLDYYLKQILTLDL